jgi:hypothetical protein
MACLANTVLLCASHRSTLWRPPIPGTPPGQFYISRSAKFISNFYTVYQVAKRSYSEVRAGANIQIIRASTGEVLWQGNHTAVIRGGGIPFGIASFVMYSVFAGMNLYGDQKVWVVQDLARRIVLAIPDLVYRGEN